MLNFNLNKPKTDFLYWFVRQGVSDVFDIFSQELDSSGKINQTLIGRCGALLKNEHCIMWDGAA